MLKYFSFFISNQIHHMISDCGKEETADVRCYLFSVIPELYICVMNSIFRKLMTFQVFKSIAVEALMVKMIKLFKSFLISHTKLVDRYVFLFFRHKHVYGDFFWSYPGLPPN